MATKQSTLFLESEEGQTIRRQLEKMVASSQYNTTSTYSSKTDIYSDNLIPFVDKHLNYLTSHPSLNPTLYLANLRLMTKLRDVSVIG